MIQRSKRDVFSSDRFYMKGRLSFRSGAIPNVRRYTKDLAKINVDELLKNKLRVDTDEDKNELPIEEMTSQDYYEDLHSYYRNHEKILRDTVYVSTFWNAICGNAHLFKNKIVLEVRCGMGILSMFCAIAGAKHVYAIDDSNIVQLARRIVRDNRLSDVITVIKGKVSDIQLPVDGVDVIVSTFFGHSLFYDHALNELLDARDKWLKPNGIIMPDRCTFYLAAMEDKLHRNRNQFWQRVYNFNMSAMNEAVNAEPFLMKVNRNQVISNACPLKRLNLYTITKDLYTKFDAAFCLEIKRSGYIEALFAYFDIEFTDCLKPLKFTLAPGSHEMHWKPMLFFLNCSDKLFGEAGEMIYGVFRMASVSEDFQKLDWLIDVCYNSKSGMIKDVCEFKTR